MRRSDFGSRSRNGGNDGLLGTLLGGRTGGHNAQQQVAQEGQDRITPRGGGRIQPTTKEVSLGITPYGETVNLKLFEKSTLIAGQSGSGKSFCSNRILMEIFKIPKDQRVVVGIDLKSGTEIGKSQYCLDAFAIDIYSADTILTNVAAEMDRRHRLINENPREYWDGKTHPSEKVPLLVCFIDELAMLGKKNPDKELEEIRKHAWSQLDRLLYLGRNAAICTICCIQRPDAKIVDSFSRAQFQQRLAGYVSSRTDSDMIFGVGTAEQGIDASKLSDHWFIAFAEGKGYQRFKTPGDPADADLKEVFLGERYFAPKGRGSWLTAEPETAEAIAPWWPDSPYHEAFLNGFRDDEDDEPDDGFGYEPAGGSYADMGDDEADDDGYWDDDDDEEPSRGSSRQPSRSASRPASRSASRRPAPSDDADYDLPWDEPRPARRPADRPDDIEEVSTEEIMGMVDESMPKPKPSGPEIEYRKSVARTIDDLQATFEEVDDYDERRNLIDDLDEVSLEEIFGFNDDDEKFWGCDVTLDEGRDEVWKDDEAGERLPLPPHVASDQSPQSVPSDLQPSHAPSPATSRGRKRAQGKRDASASQSEQQDRSSAEQEGKRKTPRRRRRRSEVPVDLQPQPERRPKMINGMPVL